MLINYILIAAIVLFVIYVIAKYYTVLKNEDVDFSEYNEELGDVDLDLKFLIEETSKAFSRSLKQNFNDDNLTRAELNKKRRKIAQLREALTEAAYGNEKSKDYVKNHIKGLLRNEKYDLNDKSINDIIPFDHPDKLKPMDKFEILLYLYNKKYSYNGFSELMDEYELYKPIEMDGDNRYIVTKEIISLVYEDAVLDLKSKKLGEDAKLDFNDKIEILTQRIFEKYIGLGPVDMLLSTTVDEIDAGVSGIPKGSFEVRTTLKNLPYSYESVWVVYKGLNIQMECLTFESQSELVRVCDNIYKYDAPYVLSRQDGRVVSTMIDGSRIVVCRPPFAESYSFFLRKFDSMPSVDPQLLFKGRTDAPNQNAIIPLVVMKWMIKGQRNIGITGSQGTGKSTMLKSLIRFIDTSLNLRVQELQFELNLRYTYPSRNIETFQETESISAQEGLNLQKKTNGSVNIIGEVATAIQASHIIQTAMVASLFAMFTHHAKTAKDFIEAISNNLLELGLYKDKKDAVAMTAKILNIDCHLENVKGNRFTQRITEIIPGSEERYLTDTEAYTPEGATPLEQAEYKVLTDTPEYYRRQTNPELYETRDIVVWEPIIDKKTGVEKGGIYKLANMPSEKMMSEIRAKLSNNEETQFMKEMEMLKIISDGKPTKEIVEWTDSLMKC